MTLLHRLFIILFVAFNNNICFINAADRVAVVPDATLRLTVAIPTIFYDADNDVDDDEVPMVRSRVDTNIIFNNLSSISASSR
jgi:hypothetical protein